MATEPIDGVGLGADEAVHVRPPSMALLVTRSVSLRPALAWSELRW